MALLAGPTPLEGGPTCILYFMRDLRGFTHLINDFGPLVSNLDPGPSLFLGPVLQALLIPTLPTNSLLGSMNTIWQRRKLRLREVKPLAQCHTASGGTGMKTGPVWLPALDLGPFCHGTLLWPVTSPCQLLCGPVALGALAHEETRPFWPWG